MNLVEYADQEMMMIDLANKLAGELNAALMSHEQATLAVPGGTTPGPIFDSLCAATLDWSRVHVMLTDERWVPESSPRSNTTLIRKRLLTGRAATASYVPLYLDAPEPEARLEEVAIGVAKALPISVLLLGMGADMHTASIFPGADNLEAALSDDAPLVMAMRAPGADEPRVTLTAHVLNDAMSKHIVIIGADKRKALERAQSLGDPVQAPICAVLDDATIHWAE